MGAVVDIGEVRISIEGLKNGLKLVSGPVKIERVSGSDDQVNLSLEIGATDRLVLLDDMGQVVRSPNMRRLPNQHLLLRG